MYKTTIPNDNEIWQQILSNLNFKRFSDTDYRLKGTNPVCGCNSDSSNNSPATSINPKKVAGVCHKCGKGFNLYELAKAIGISITTNNSIKTKPKQEGASSHRDNHKGKITLKDREVCLHTIEQYHKKLLSTPDKLKEFIAKYRLSIETIKFYKIGLNNNYYVIPITNPDGTYNLKHHKGMQTKGSKVTLYPKNILETKHDTLIIFEGEFKALLAIQWGFNAVAITGGAGTFKSDMVNMIVNMSVDTVVLAYDADEEGQKGQLKAAKALNGKVKTIKVIKWLPEMDSKELKDINDFAVKLGKTRDDFQELIDEAVEFLPERDLDSIVLPVFIQLEKYEDGTIKNINILQEQLLIFLEQNGFHCYEYDNKIFLIKIDGCFIELTEKTRIKNYVLDYIRDFNIKPLLMKDKIIEKFHKNISNIFTEFQMTSLRFYKPDFIKETRHKAYFFFKNCWIEINKDNINVKKYEDLKQHVWKNKVKDYNFIFDDTEGDFEIYLKNVSSYKSDSIEAIMEDEDSVKRGDRVFRISSYESKVTALGYIIHGYKDVAGVRAIICVDAEIVKNNERKGRTGKSLFAKQALSKLKNLLEVDGKKQNSDNRFMFQRVELDTEVILFDDITYKFNFNDLFNVITSGIQVEKKNQKEFRISFEDSPKIIITSNHVLKGEGDSYEGRQHIIEFTDFYKHSDYKGIETIHGYRFFDDWDEAEYNRFYTFCFNCVQEFLRRGFVKSKTKSYIINKFYSKTPIELVEWFEEKIELGFEYKKTQMLENLINETNLKKMSSNSLTKSLKAWCEIKKYRINAHKNGDRDSKNGIDYITITK